MSKKLVKTQTKISTGICMGGASVHIHSPEIARITSSRDNLITFLWENKKEFEKISGRNLDSSFDSMVKFFAAPKKVKDEYYAKIVDRNFWSNIFNYIKRSHVDRKIGIPHDISIDNKDYIFVNNTLNLRCFCDPEIATGKEFKMKGLFNEEIVRERINVLLREYAYGLIKTFKGFNKA